MIIDSRSRNSISIAAAVAACARFDFAWVILLFLLHVVNIILLFVVCRWLYEARDRWKKWNFTMKRQWIMLSQMLSMRQCCIKNAYQKCITRLRVTFSTRCSFQFGIIFALINDASCDSVLFLVIWKKKNKWYMHFIRPAASFRFSRGHILLSHFPLWLHIYLFIYFPSSTSFCAMPILFLFVLQSIAIYLLYVHKKARALSYLFASCS